MTGTVLAILAIVPSAFFLLSALGYQLYVARWRRNTATVTSYPHVTVIAPQRGPIDPAGVEALLAQEYPGRWEILFVTTEEDAAYSQLQPYAEARANVRLLPARDVVRLAETEGIHRGQKSENLLTAIEASDPDTEFFATIDADVCPSRDWLRSLIEPFYRATHPPAATTMARISLPGANWPSCVNACWTLGSVCYLLVTTIFTWGGSMAFPKEVLKKTNVLERWRGQRGSISTDDLHLGMALRQAKWAPWYRTYGIAFVPGAMGMSCPPGRDPSFAGLFGFMTRQMVHTKWVQKRLFSATLVVCGMKAVGLLGTLVFMWSQPWLALLLLTPLTEPLALWWINRTLESITPPERLAPGRLHRAILLAGPATQLLAGLVCFKALVTTRIHWSGNTYSRRHVLGRTGDSSWKRRSVDG